MVSATVPSGRMVRVHKHLAPQALCKAEVLVEFRELQLGMRQSPVTEPQRSSRIAPLHLKRAPKLFWDRATAPQTSI